MRHKKTVMMVSAFVALGAAACTANINNKIEKNGQFWQRTSVSDAGLMQGPKAQVMLNQSIASCVTELNELERLGTLRNAIPADPQGRVLDPDQLEMAKWDTPERNSSLYAEHLPYHDFEGCMLAAGWERVEYLPYKVADKARGDYLEAHIDYDYQTRFEKERTYKKTSVDEAEKRSPYNE